jgi:hypothetical protein
MTVVSSDALAWPSQITWQPMVLPHFRPVPLRGAKELLLKEPLVLEPADARFLALGLGRIDMEVR